MDENMMAHIGELAHEKQASITAEDWERMFILTICRQQVIY
jgi:hypothetical protein